MQNRFYKINLVFILSLAATACVQNQTAPQPNYYPANTQPQPYPTQGYNNIPPNFLPPPGKCRIWYSDRPLEAQPASGDCKKLKKRVPANATLIYPPNNQQYAPQPYPTQNYDIPPGFMPPPGQCRIWYPDRPPGHQPPPDKCKKLQKNVPYGATLIRG